MSHLVSEDEEGLRDRGFGDGVVPDDDALGGAKAGDVGVQASLFGAGVHHEHAVGGNIHAAAMDDFLHLLNQDGLSAGERFEGVKQRIDDDGLQEEDDNRIGMEASQK